LLDRADAGLFIEFALGGRPGVLAGINPALRHLPDMVLVDMLDAAGATADEDEPVAVEQHHADAGPIGQVFVARHSVRTPDNQTGKPGGFQRVSTDRSWLDFDFSIAVVNGTSMMPRPSSALHQAASRSIEIGSAEAMPTAAPRSRAMVSSFDSAR